VAVPYESGCRVSDRSHGREFVMVGHAASRVAYAEVILARCRHTSE
jgi:hypothetical protein